MENNRKKIQLCKGKRHCAVTNCSHGDYELCNWLKSMCPEQNCSFENEEKCPCLPPFCLFNFPTRLKKPLDRHKWIQLWLINRSSSVSGSNKLWSPKKSSHICSMHFVDGMPTKQNPYPTVNLGYDAKRKVEHIIGSGSTAGLQPKRRRLKKAATKTLKIPAPSCSSGSIAAAIADVDHDHLYISSYSHDESSINIGNLNIASDEDEYFDIENSSFVKTPNDGPNYVFGLVGLLFLLISYISTGEIVSLALLIKDTFIQNVACIKSFVIQLQFFVPKSKV